MEYKWIDLEKATQIGRLHKKSIQPPNLLIARNFLVSRSDGSLTLRPDFDAYDGTVQTLVSQFQFADTDDDVDYLQAASGAFGTDKLVWITRFFLYQEYEHDVPEIWNGYTSTGEIATTGNDTEIVGTNTYFNYDAGNTEDNIWRGCILHIPYTNEFYIVDGITDNTHLDVTKAPSATLAGLQYRLYKTHCVLHAGYKPHIVPYWQGILYNNPTLDEVNPQNVHGPLSSVATETREGGFSWSTSDASANTADVMNRENKIFGKLFAQADGDGTMLVIGGHGNGSDPTSMHVAADASTSYSINGWTSYSKASNTITDSIGSPRSICYDSTNDRFLAVTSDGAATHTIHLHKSSTGLDGSWTHGTETCDTAGETTRNRCVVTDGTTIYVYEGVDASNSMRIYKTTDSGATWAESTVALGVGGNTWGVSGIWCEEEDKFVVINGNGYIAYSTDGLTNWGTCLIHGNGGIEATDILWDGRWFYVTGGSDGNLYVKSELTNGWTTNDMPNNNLPYNLHRPSGGNRVYIGCSGGKAFWTDNGGNSIHDMNLDDYDNYDTNVVIGGIGRQQDRIVCVGAESYPNNPPTGTHQLFILGYDTTQTISWKFTNYFLPISTSYRACSFEIVGTYLLLLSTREWNADTSVWDFKPRRIRWSKPGSISDFSDDNAGFADLEGSGTILDARTVNNRVITFETNNIGCISARGVIEDPFQYEVIAYGTRTLSNPVVVEDVCYFIAQDGLLWQTDGISCKETGSSFDITKYDDFDETKPIWLSYSNKTNSLYASQRDDTLSTHTLYQINVGNGTVTEHTIHDKLDTNTLNMLSSLVVENANTSNVLIGFSENPDETYIDSLSIGDANFGSSITGYDDVVPQASNGDYWYGLLETGEMYLNGEGGKSQIIRLNVATYCDSGTDSSYNPYVGVQIRSLEDTAWWDRGDSFGTITVGTSDCVGTLTAWSNKIARAGNDVDGATSQFAICSEPTRVYLETGSTYTLQVAGTDYTYSNNVLDFGSNVDSSYSIYAYWDNDYPQVVMKAGDFIQTDEGIHRVTAVLNATALSLDHYHSTGSATGTHIPAEQIPDGDGEISIGLNRLVEGVRVRIYVMPHASSDATVTKILGMTIVHEPHGDRVEEATGS